MFAAKKHYVQAEEPVRQTGVSKADWNRHLAAAFQPIMRGLLLPMGIYYAIIVVSHYMDEPTPNFLILGGISAVSSAVAFALYLRLRRAVASFAELELQSLMVWGLIFANILAYHLLHLEVTKLIYFVLLTLIMATTTVSMRVVVPTCFVCLATAIWLANFAGPQTVSQFSFIAFASSFVAIGIATLMRRALRREISSRLKADELREAAEQSANHDPLTGLPNRRAFFRKLREAFADPAHGNQLCVGVIDLNGFKPVNDLYGHVFGDKLLTQVGERIAAICGPDCLVARMGGDEFTLLIDKPMSDNALKNLGARINSVVGETYNIAGTQIAISTAIGFARRVASVDDPSKLYEHADFALYDAKRSGGGAVEIFSVKDEKQLHEVKMVERQLRDGDLDAEMFVVFQPQIDIKTGQTVGLEALARWRNPVLGLVRPDVFIRAAERNGTIKEVTPLLLVKALAQAVHWPDDVRLSFNLSARDIMSPESVEQIIDIVQASRFDGRRIDFEITETSIMTDFNRVRSSIRRLQTCGAKFALDDFGVGYSNFEHIDQLNIHKVKVDRQFVARLGQGGNTGKIVTTMIEMCANLELECVIEGVETQFELERVTAAGARLVQGFYFSEPLAADDVLDFLADLHLQRDERTRDYASA